MDLRLRRKLLSVVVVVAVVCAPAIVIGIRLNARLADTRQHSEAYAHSLDQLNAVQDALLTGVRSLEAYVTLGALDTRYVDEYRVAVDPLPDRLSALVEDAPAGLEGPTRELKAALETLLDQLEPLTTYGVAGGQDPSTMSPTDIPFVGDLFVGMVASASANEAIEQLEARFDDRLVEERERSDDLQRQLVGASLGGMVLALSAAAIGTYAVSSRIVRRIEQLSENSDRFLRDEPVRPGLASRDELGQLIRRMSFLGQRLDDGRIAAEQATLAKDHFLARVSHELKTPLTAMIGFAQLLEEEPGLAPASAAAAGRIVDDGNRLHQLIQELLDIKALEAGRLSLDIEPIPLRGAIADTIVHVRPAAAERSIRISVDCPRDAVVAADRRRLHEVLQHLLANAIEHNHERGRVEVQVSEEGRALRVAVSDTGPGIGLDAREALLAPLERLEAAGNTRLALVRRVVEAMGGSVGVDSILGHGSTFWFRLPEAEAPSGIVAGSRRA